MQSYIVHYGELGLKGRNRISFEKQLIRNLRVVLRDFEKTKVRRFHSYIIVNVADTAPAQIVEQRLSRIFGIAYFAPVSVVPRDLESISAAALKLIDGVITTATTFKVATRRGDKRYPIKSHEVSREIGARIVAATSAPVKLKSPDVTLNIQIYDDDAYLFVRRFGGAGGLPVGVSGRVLTLFSGGIDSPVAAHMLLKRGCLTDFLHFHLLPNEQAVRDSKVVTMARTVLAPHQRPSQLYMASAAPFEVVMAELDSRVATVVFRRFVMRAAEIIAPRRNALALVTGESVGQVASQTLQNMNLIAQATNFPILRPLVGLDKSEIIISAKQIDTYELSIQPYIDPCSMHARHPSTHARLEAVLEVEEQIDVDALLEETMQNHLLVLPIEFGGTAER